MPADAPSSRQSKRCQDILDIVKLHKPCTFFEIGPEHGWTGKAIRDSYPDCYLAAVDIWPAYVDLVAQRGWYNEVALGDCFTFMDGFLPQGFEVVIAADVIEHMSKEDGLKLINEMERVGSLAIITTPIGFMKQGIHEGNPYQKHLSGWTPEEFRDRGWEVPVVDVPLEYFIAYKDFTV